MHEQIQALRVLARPGRSADVDEQVPGTPGKLANILSRLSLMGNSFKRVLALPGRAADVDELVPGTPGKLANILSRLSLMGNSSKGPQPPW